MTTYNPNDFSPMSGKEINSQGNVVTPADGINVDGSQTVEDKVGLPVLIDTIPYSSFTASASLLKQYSGKLTRNAKKREIIIKNSLDQAISSLKFYPEDSTVYIGGGLNGDSITFATPPLTGQAAYYSSNNNPILSSPVDSFGLSMGMGATAPISGNVYIYVTEIL